MIQGNSSGSLEFHVHDTFYEQRLSLNATRMFIRCGNATARGAADGVVPAELPYLVMGHTPEEGPFDVEMAINELVGAGFWTPLADGRFTMNHGPTDDWNEALPLWRYSSPMIGVEVAPGCVIFPDPDA